MGTVLELELEVWIAAPVDAEASAAAAEEGGAPAEDDPPEEDAPPAVEVTTTTDVGAAGVVDGDNVAGDGAGVLEVVEVVELETGGGATASGTV